MLQSEETKTIQNKETVLAMEVAAVRQEPGGHREDVSPTTLQEQLGLARHALASSRGRGGGREPSRDWGGDCVEGSHGPLGP
ncbi:hypothetical protein NDU88_001777 [Pleurodeles waltl]|uniref:Uncharacterized protein n=1 Tax=Pleurodeles waltl TaxID=8319 RepID=A0AAV7RDT1_PLEWA|nr:hypothetical protein NDU88_001777 [Pleurodeles waltl]